MAKENIYLESKPRYEVLDVLIKGTYIPELPANDIGKGIIAVATPRI